MRRTVLSITITITIVTLLAVAGCATPPAPQQARMQDPVFTTWSQIFGKKPEENPTGWYRAAEQFMKGACPSVKLSAYDEFNFVGWINSDTFLKAAARLKGDVVRAGCTIPE